MPVSTTLRPVRRATGIGAPARLAATLLTATLVATASPAFAAASDDGQSGATAGVQSTLGLPRLGNLDLIGVDDQDTWAYGRLERVPAFRDGQRIPAQPFVDGDAASPIVFARATAGGGWRIVGQVEDAAGRALSSAEFDVPQLRGQLASMDPSSGAGALFGQTTSDAGATQVLAIREPGSTTFRLVPAPSVSPGARNLLLGAGGVDALVPLPEAAPAPAPAPVTPTPDAAPSAAPAVAPDAALGEAQSVSDLAPATTPEAEPAATTPELAPAATTPQTPAAPPATQAPDSPIPAQASTPQAAPVAPTSPATPISRAAAGRVAAPAGPATLAAGESLYDQSRQLLLATRESDGTAGALVGIANTGPVEDSVFHWNGSAWSREPLELPTAFTSSSFQLVALAGTGLSDAWLLGQASATTGAGLVLLHRDADAHWRIRSLASSPFGSSSDASSGATAIAPLTQPGSPLTVSPDGLWMDGSFQLGGQRYPFSVYYDKSAQAITGSWCDAGAALCEYRLGAGLDASPVSTTSGYLSFAWSGSGPFGQRVITNPQPTRTATGRGDGTRLALAGTRFRRVAGLGEGGPDAAFRDPQEGWLRPNGVALVQVTASRAPNRLQPWSVTFRRPLLAIAPEPGKAVGAGEAQAIAVGIDGAVARYQPGLGWDPEFLLNAAGVRQTPDLRSVAWPEPGRIHAVGSDGEMWVWRQSTGLWEPDGSKPLDFSGNLMAVAFQPGNPDRGYAVGRQGALLAYGKTWEQQQLPTEVRGMDLTSISFAGTRAYVVWRSPEGDRSGLLINDGAGWEIDHTLDSTLAETTATALSQVDGLLDGGVIVAGDRGVFKRSAPGDAWQFTALQTPGPVVALNTLRQSGELRAIVSVDIRSDRYPARVVLTPDVAGQSPQLLPAIDPPLSGALLAEQADGSWSDETHSVAPNTAQGTDLAAEEDQVFALALDPLSGQGWAIGGAVVRTDNEVGSAEDKALRRTARVFRYPADPSLIPPTASDDPIDLSKPVVRFAIGGHAACRSACSDLANSGLPADVGLRRALSRAGAVAQRPGGPRAFLYTGTRLESGALDSDEAGQFARSAQSTPGLPFFPAAAADAAGDGTEPYLTAFDPFPAPFGSGATPQNVSLIDGLAEQAPKPGLARNHYAFDSLGAAGTVRVIVIDNSSGSLAASDGHNNPADPSQEGWLISALRTAKDAKIPAIVVGNRDLNSLAGTAGNVAEDADRIAQILVNEGASAYFFDAPNANRSKSIPAAGIRQIPEFGTGTLGLSSSEPLSLSSPYYGEPGYLLAELDAARRDPATNVAPVSVRLIPVVDELALDALDGTLLRRSKTALFRAVGRRPLMGGVAPYVTFPTTACKLVSCPGRIDPEYTFSSSRPDVADFVARDPRTSDERVPLRGVDGRPVSSSASSLLCAFNAGTTTITVRAGGLAFSQNLTVQGGAVGQPCGTRVSSTPAVKGTSVSAPPVAPAPTGPAATPTGAVPVSIPPPPAPPAAPVTPNAPTPSVPVAATFLPVAVVPALLAPLPVPPPTVARPLPPPTPPGVPVSQPVTQVEEKREEEEAYESSSAYAIARPRDEVRTSGGLVMAIILMAAGVGAAGTASRRRPERRMAHAHVRLTPRERPLPRRR